MHKVSALQETDIMWYDFNIIEKILFTLGLAFWAFVLFVLLFS